MILVIVVDLLGGGDAVQTAYSVLDAEYILISEVLQKYPDGDKKREHIADLIKTHALAHEDCAVIEKYLTSPCDSIDTKATVINAAVANGMDVSLEFVVRNILPVAGNENTLSILDAYCSKKLVDDDVFRILNFACACKDSKTAVGALDCLKRGNQYVLVPSKTVIAMLSERDLTASDKISILDKLFEFKVEAKSVEAVMTNYLCFNQDPVATRKEVILYLLDKSPQLPTSTVQNYVLKCAVDGNEKPAIVKAIFDKGLNTSFFNELLSKYMNSSTDSNEVKAEITDILSGGGLKIDPSSFIEYICGTQADVPTKIQFIKKMKANGSRLRSDAASTYLERTAPNQFSSELFSLIFTPASSFSAKAAERYLLYCRDREAIKAQNFRTIAERCSGGIGTMTCQVSHAGDSISCNILAQICFFKEDGQRQILMGERSHLASKISVYLLVIERRFRGRHGIVGSTVDEVGDRLDNDFVIAGNKRIKVYSHISGNRPNDLLVCKVASNRRNAGGIVAGRNDARQTLRRTDADIAAHDR